MPNEAAAAPKSDSPDAEPDGGRPRRRPPTSPGEVQNPREAFRKSPGPASKAVRYGVRGLIAVVIVGVGFGGFQIMRNLRPPVPRADRDAAALVVLAQPVARTSVSRVWEGFGTARPLRESDIPAEIDATVLRRAEGIEDGSPVEAGQALLVLDARDVIDRLAAADQRVAALRASLSSLEVEEARLGEQVRLSRQERDTAQRDLERTQNAVAAGAGTESEIDAREAALNRADRSLEALVQQLELIPSRRAQTRAQLAGEQATAEQARRDVERAEIKAPFDGTLQRILPRAGERVRLGEVVARLVDLSLIEVPLRVPVSAAPSIRVGDRVELVRDGAGIDGAGWSGAVARIAPEADEATRTMTVFVRIEQDPQRTGEAGLLRPGQFVIGRVESAPGAPGLLVPRDAVRGDRAYILGAPPEGAEGDDPRRLVEAVSVEVRHDYAGSVPGAASSDRQWVVLEPGGELDSADMIVTTNLDQLIEGTIVQPAGEGGSP